MYPIQVPEGISKSRKVYCLRCGILSIHVYTVFLTWLLTISFVVVTDVLIST